MRISRALFCAATVAFLPVAANAGGFDVTGQPIGIIFEEGNYIEAGVGLISANVEGTNIAGDAGDIADNLAVITGGAKTDITDNISAAIIFDRPFHRKTTYNDGLFVGTRADVIANSLTLVGRYKINENFSVYGGPRVQRASIDLDGPRNILPYSYEGKDLGYGFVLGAAAEIPEYKIRAAVTYNSEIDHNFDSAESVLTPAGALTRQSNTDVHTPQSVNLDIQAPVSPSTLVIANIRWVEWGGVDLAPSLFRDITRSAAAPGGRKVVEYTEDTISYRLTVAQRLNENFVGFVTGSYEADGGEQISLFKTVDGSMSFGGGVIYENDSGLTLRLAAEYIWLEGTSGVQVVGTPRSSYDNDSTALAASFKVGYRF